MIQSASVTLGPRNQLLRFVLSSVRRVDGRFSAQSAAADFGSQSFELLSHGQSRRRSRSTNVHRRSQSASTPRAVNFLIHFHSARRASPDWLAITTAQASCPRPRVRQQHCHSRSKRLSKTLVSKWVITIAGLSRSKCACLRLFSSKITHGFHGCSKMVLLAPSGSPDFGSGGAMF